MICELGKPRRAPCGNGTHSQPMLKLTLPGFVTITKSEIHCQTALGMHVFNIGVNRSCLPSEQGGLEHRLWSTTNRLNFYNTHWTFWRTIMSINRNTFRIGGACDKLRSVNISTSWFLEDGLNILDDQYCNLNSNIIQLRHEVKGLATVKSLGLKTCHSLYMCKS
jgi:hypothetical protein